METLITPEQETTIKNHIEVEFIEISRYYVPSLCAFITTNAPGNPIIVFREFKKRFNSLYTLSSAKKDLNKDLIGKVKIWMAARHSGNNKDIEAGLKLFDEYKNELFKTNILRMG